MMTTTLNKQLETTTTKEITAGFSSLAAFEFTQRVASMFAKSSLVPKEYQNNMPNCIIAVNMAARMEADPLMVMQNLYIVYNRPSWSSQFLISVFNACSKVVSPSYNEILVGC